MEKKSPLKRALLIAAIVFVVLIVLVVVFSGDDSGGGGSKKYRAASRQGNLDWVVYWYLCGSNLESESGNASADLEEMFSVELPPGVAVVIQTGGASAWGYDEINPDRIGRFLYDSTGFKKLEEVPNISLGSTAALEDFLRFCEENYPAKKRMVLFWDHGGGSTSGVAFDENYDYDYLSLEEIREVFDRVYELSKSDPPLEILGFDACLMATLDVAYVSRDIARYLVASEETEPGLGWDYEGFLSALAKNPRMNGVELGQTICDTFQAACAEWEMDDDITLSVIDLSRLDPLVLAYNRMGREALSQAAEDSRFFSKYNRLAGGIENYGVNSRAEGYTDMADLGHLLRNAGDMFPSGVTEEVHAALNECVVYSIAGPYRNEASGLSIYHPYDMDQKNWETFKRLGTSEAFAYFYEYNITGNYTEAMYNYLAKSASSGPAGAPSEYIPASITTVQELDLENYPLSIEEYQGENYVTLNVGARAAENLTGVYFDLDYFDEESGEYWYLGYDNDLDIDWVNGIFRDNFSGEWPSIGGFPLYIELYYEGDSDADEAYDIYHSPIRLNGREYTLEFVYNYDLNKFKIMGARRGFDNAMSKDRRRLKSGDEITLLTHVYNRNEDFLDDHVAIGSFTYEPGMSIEWDKLWEGKYRFMFGMMDAREEYVYSEPAWFTISPDGDIFMSLEE